MITEYELYSDERAVTGSNGRLFFLGGVICTQAGRGRLLEKLSDLRRRHSLSSEMKWEKVSRRFVDCYRQWVDVFFNDPHARFALFTIDVSSVAWNSFQPRPHRRASRDERLASAFHQFLLSTFRPLRDTKRWWVYPDAGLFSREQILRRIEFLFNHTYKQAFGQKSSRIIRLARSLDSTRADLVQLADVLLGALTWNVVGTMPVSPAKSELVEHCSRRVRERPINQRGLPTLLTGTWVPPGQFHYA